MVGDQDLVAFAHLEVRERREAGVDSDRGVPDEDQPLGIRPDELRHLRPDLSPQAHRPFVQEPEWLQFQLVTKRLLVCEYRPGTGTERTVIEEHDLGIERPVDGMGRAVGLHGLSRFAAPARERGWL